MNAEHRGRSSHWTSLGMAYPHAPFPNEHSQGLLKVDEGQKNMGVGLRHRTAWSVGVNWVLALAHVAEVRVPKYVLLPYSCLISTPSFNGYQDMDVTDKMTDASKGRLHLEGFRTNCRCTYIPCRSGVFQQKHLEKPSLFGSPLGLLHNASLQAHQESLTKTDAWASVSGGSQLIVLISQLISRTPLTVWGSNATTSLSTSWPPQQKKSSLSSEFLPRGTWFSVLNLQYAIITCKIMWWRVLEGWPIGCCWKIIIKSGSHEDGWQIQNWQCPLKDWQAETFS